MISGKDKYFKIKTFLCGAVAAIGLLVFTGWAAHSIILKSVWSGDSFMDPLTALNLSLLSIGILILNDQSTTRIKALVKVISGIVFVLMLLKISDLVLLTGIEMNGSCFQKAPAITRWL